MSYLEVTRKALKDTIDFHIHSGPDTWSGISGPSGGTRLIDDFEAAEMAREAEMKGIVLKSHDMISSARAYLVSRKVPGIHVFGGVVLNYPVGGINPTAVKSAVKFGGGLGKVVWLPTKDAANDLTPKSVERRRSFGRPGLTITQEGELIPEMEEVLNVVAENDLVLATAHTSLEEKQILLEETHRLGLRKVLITHPESRLSGILMNIQVQREIVSRGAYLEYCFENTMPLSLEHIRIDQYVDAVRAIGPEHIILSTDFGQVYNPTPVDGLRMFIVSLIQRGLSQSDIDMMTKSNPAKLLGIE
ncbi:MAG: DUF6282 family protein [Candidatus Bathyarchaeia archaeon]